MMMAICFTLVFHPKFSLDLINTHIRLNGCMNVAMSK
jgi:hypothetical protein